MPETLKQFLKRIGSKGGRSKSHSKKKASKKNITKAREVKKTKRKSFDAFADLEE